MEDFDGISSQDNTDRIIVDQDVEQSTETHHQNTMDQLDTNKQIGVRYSSRRLLSLVIKLRFSVLIVIFCLITIISVGASFIRSKKTIEWSDLTTQNGGLDEGDTKQDRYANIKNRSGEKTDPELQTAKDAQNSSLETNTDQRINDQNGNEEKVNQELRTDKDAQNSLEEGNAFNFEIKGRYDVDRVEAGRSDSYGRGRVYSNYLMAINENRKNSMYELVVFDISNYNSFIKVAVKEYYDLVQDGSPVAVEIDYARKVLFVGGFADFKIFDLTKLPELVEIKKYGFAASTTKFDGMLFDDGYGGVYEFWGEYFGGDMIIDGNFLIMGTCNLRILDISDPMDVKLIGSYKMKDREEFARNGSGCISDINKEGNFVMADRWGRGGLAYWPEGKYTLLIDISDVFNPKLTKRLPELPQLYEPAFKNGVMYLTSLDAANVAFYDLSNVENTISEIGRLSTSFKSLHSRRLGSDRLMLIAPTENSSASQVEIINIGNMKNPRSEIIYPALNISWDNLDYPNLVSIGEVLEYNSDFILMVGVSIIIID